MIGDRLGPAIARDDDAGRAVVARLAPAAPGRDPMPAPNEVAHRALADAGFADVRELWRMRLGAPLPSRVDWLWTLASPGAG